MTSKMKDQYIAIVIAILFLGSIYISTIQTRIPNDTSINGAPVETMEHNEKVAPQAQKETMKNDEKWKDLNDCPADFKTRQSQCIIAGIRKVGTRDQSANFSNTALLDRAKNGTQIVYNRVPKCGSTSFLEVINLLAKRNGFRYEQSKIYSQFDQNERKQKELVKRITRLKEPFLYDRHVYMIDFERFGKQQPIYINLIRDPLDRFISDYYYSWQPGRLTDKAIVNKTIDSCIRINMPTCVNPMSHAYWTTIHFFCGQDDICREPSYAALELAKQNVHMYYPVVGVTEMFEDFLHALEVLMPHYFDGGRAIYSQLKKNRTGRMNKTKNPKKEPLSENGSNVIKANLKLEYDFYKFIKQRFHYLMTNRV